MSTVADNLIVARRSRAHREHVRQTEMVITGLRRLMLRCHRTGIDFQSCYQIAYDETARRLVRRHARASHLLKRNP